jgi:hypothetical protein
LTLLSKQGSIQGGFKPAHDSAAFDKPLGHEPFGREPLGHELEAEWLRVERLEAEWLRPRASRGELVAGLPISLSTKVAACVRRFETLTPLNHGRPALALSFWSCVWIGEHFTSQLSLLMPYEPGLGRDRVKKRYLHAHHTVFFMYNPEAKLRGLC